MPAAEQGPPEMPFVSHAKKPRKNFNATAAEAAMRVPIEHAKSYEKVLSTDSLQKRNRQCDLRGQLLLRCNASRKDGRNAALLTLLKL